MEQNAKQQVKIKYKRVRTPTLIQMEATECGAASLGIILGYYGRFIPLEELRVSCGVSRDGSNALNIVKAAKAYGLEAKGYRRELNELLELPLPFIAHWGFNHFIVIEGFSKKHVYINDPASGPRKISYADLDASFTGVVIALEKGPNFKVSQRPPLFSSPLLQRVGMMKGGLFFLILIGLMAVIPQLALVAFTQVFMDYFLIGKVLWWKWSFIIGMGIVCLFILSLQSLKQQLLNRIYLKLSLLFSTQFFWHVMTLPMSFFAQRFSGEVANRMALNDGVALALVSILTDGVVNVIVACVFGLAMFYYDPIIASIAVGIVSFNGILAYILYRSRQDAYSRLQQDVARSSGFAVGGLQNMETIKATNTETKFFSRWVGYYSKFLNSLQFISQRDIIAGTFPTFFDSLAMITVLMAGTWRIMDGYLTLGMLVAIQILMRNFTTPIFTLLGLMQPIQLLKVDSARLDDVLNNKADPALKRDMNISNKETKDVSKVKLEGYLQLKNVTFGFNPIAKPLIHHIDLNLSPGKSIALVGPSGCGKSTLAKLIGGLFEPWKGEILLDGIPRHELNRQIITNSLAVVQQEPALFAESVRDNISLMETYPLQADLIRAAKDACIHEDILKRKGGYDLILEQGGGNLSGGQRQRLEIARALYRNPTILVLDEATSALDSVTEAEVIKNIRRRGCACLMVAHRLSTIKNCDEILVISKGTVVQRGTHLELSQQPGLYQSLVQIEKLNEQAQEGAS